MPEPITMPMPSAVSETGPSVLCSAFSGSSESEISLSMDLVAKICLGSGVLLEAKSFYGQRSKIGGDETAPQLCLSRTRGARSVG